jgi:hypothetical protein
VYVNVLRDENPVYVNAKNGNLNIKDLSRNIFWQHALPQKETQIIRLGASSDPSLQGNETLQCQPSLSFAIATISFWASLGFAANYTD